MFNYSTVQNTGDRLISKFGHESEDALIVRLYSTETLKFYEVEQGINQFNTAVVILPMSKSDKDNVIAAGFNQIHKYHKILISGKASEIKIDDVVITDQNYKIFQVKRLKPSTVTVLWTAYAIEVTDTPSIKVWVQEDGKVVVDQDGKAMGVVI